MRPSALIAAGNSLHSYLQYRAAEKGVGYSFSPEFFTAAIKDGCTEFFGIVFNNRGQLIWDNEKPDLFKTWKIKN